jgi:hypothetical protein
MTASRDKGERALAARIDGGYEAISVTQLLMVWWAYQARLIQKLDLRVWFACWELEIRRRLSDGRYRPSLAELKRLVGSSTAKGQGGLGGSLRRLRALGLLRSCSKDGIVFAESPDELRHDDLGGLWAMLGQVSSPGRRIPVPRRILRRLAGGLSKSRTAVVLAHLIRCLFYSKGKDARSRGINPTGCCKASWVARVFGITERSVHDARGYLIEDLGWLVPGACSQHVLNRDGLWVSIDLDWGGDPEEAQGANCLDSVETIPPTEPTLERAPTRLEGPSQTGQGGQIPASPGNGFSPPPADSAGQFSAPGENKKPLRDHKNQKPASRPPACGGPAGVCTGDSPGKRPERRPEQDPATPPTLSDITASDLRDTGRILGLFEQATACGHLGASEADRLKFVAGAVHAQAVGSEPCRLFAWLIRSGRWEVITQADEDEARARLKRHLRAESGPINSPGNRPGNPPPKRPALSADALVVRQLREVLRQRGIHADPFAAAKHALPDWTRGRWDDAAREIEQAGEYRPFSGISSLAEALGRIEPGAGTGCNLY